MPGAPYAPSPRLRGEGWGEGDSPRIRIRGESPSPAAHLSMRVGLSPQAGRGESYTRNSFA